MSLETKDRNTELELMILRQFIYDETMEKIRNEIEMMSSLRTEELITLHSIISVINYEAEMLGLSVCVGHNKKDNNSINITITGNIEDLDKIEMLIRSIFDTSNANVYISSSYNGVVTYTGDILDILLFKYKLSSKDIEKIMSRISEEK